MSCTYAVAQRQRFIYPYKILSNTIVIYCASSLFVVWRVSIAILPLLGWSFLPEAEAVPHMFCHSEAVVQIYQYYILSSNDVCGVQSQHSNSSP